MESQVYLEYDGSALRSVAGISFINTFSEISWKSIRGGSRSDYHAMDTATPRRGIVSGSTMCSNQGKYRGIAGINNLGEYWIYSVEWTNDRGSRTLIQM